MLGRCGVDQLANVVTGSTTTTTPTPTTTTTQGSHEEYPIRCTAMQHVSCSRTCVLVLCVLLAASAFLQPCDADCHDEKSLEEREEMANVVVTGTVKKIMSPDGSETNGMQRDGNHAMYRSEIEIKRVFKGDDVVNELANVFIDPVRHHKMVVVEGFGDPHICDNEVHVADTKIFLLTKGYNGVLRLNSSIMPITLSNLDYTEAVVKSEWSFFFFFLFF